MIMMLLDYFKILQNATLIVLVNDSTMSMLGTSVKNSKCSYSYETRLFG